MYYRYFFPHMKEIVLYFVRRCQGCMATKRVVQNIPLQPIFASKPGERLNIDYTFLVETSRGNKCALNIVDHFTKRYDA